MKTVKKVWNWILSFALVLTLVPVSAQTAQAAEAVPYISRSWDAGSKTVKDSEQSCAGYVLVTQESVASQNFDREGFEIGSGASGGDFTWIVISGEVTFSYRITVSGDANVILCDGATLMAKKGITVSDGNSLTIYGQSEGTGTLVATATEVPDNAGIGGNGAAGGTITINGGTVNANGGAAGIGGGVKGAGGTVTIYGGTVTATGGLCGAGIGGGNGSNGGTVTIYGGIVTATGGDYGAGIGAGSGYPNTGGTITINGGTVNANGGLYGAGIGGGYQGTGGTITINGGTVNANGGKCGAGIGGGVQGAGGIVAINAGTVTATGGELDGGGTIYIGMGIGAGFSATDHGELTLGANLTLTTSTDGSAWAESVTTDRKQYMMVSPSVTNTASVTITAGSNMTKTTDSGEASQIGLSGAMTDVVYMANDGYYFPESYSVAAVNEISVTRNSYTQITISGTPTANAAITLTEPTAKTKPNAPTTAAAVNCTNADNNDGKLTGVTDAMEYKKSDAADWTAGTGSDITGLAPGTYYVRVKATDTTLASDNQTLVISGYNDPTDTDTPDSGSGSTPANTADTATEKVPYEKVAISAGQVKDITGIAEATAETNPYGTKIENSDSLTLLLSLTDAEVAEGVNVWLDVQDISSAVSQAEQSLIRTASADYTVGTYLDINLFKKVGNNAAAKLTETNGALRVSIVIPEAIRGSGRSYEIIRVHNGTAAVLPGAYDEATHIFTFETDQFSTYAIAYKDPTAASVSTVSANNTVPTDSDDATQINSPQTYDPNYIRLLYLMLLLSIGGLGFTVILPKKTAS